MSTFKTLEEALDILDQDIAKIKTLAAAPETLDRSEASKLTDYIKVLIAVNKEEREQIKSENLLSKSDEDLEELAKEALKFLGKDVEDEETEPEEKEVESTDSVPPDDPKG